MRSPQSDEHACADGAGEQGPADSEGSQFSAGSDGTESFHERGQMGDSVTQHSTGSALPGAAATGIRLSVELMAVAELLTTRHPVRFSGEVGRQSHQ